VEVSIISSRAALFRRLLSLASRSVARRLLLGESEALGLFATHRAFLNVISTFIMSHEASIFARLVRHSNAKVES
jgi:hypothetical protein